MASFISLLLISFCSISYADPSSTRFFVTTQDDMQSFSFKVLTLISYPNKPLPTKSLESYIGSCFLSSISKGFNISNSPSNTLYIEVNSTQNDDTSSDESNNTITHISSTESILLFEFYSSSHTGMKLQNFTEYIYYGFLRRYLTIEFDIAQQNSSDSDSQFSNYSLSLSSIEWIEHDTYSCIEEENVSNPAWHEVFDALQKDIFQFLLYCFFTILGLSIVFLIVGYAHSWIVWNTDIYVGNVIFFCFSMVDWYSDILFTFKVESLHMHVFIACFALLIFPLIANVVWLVTQQKVWEEDAAIGNRVKSWLNRWRPFLYSLTILTGSSFGAINMVNSNFFGYPLFRMGLRQYHMTKFDSKRLLFVVFGENLPQLALQMYYGFYLTHTFHYMLGLAMISGMVSILYAVGTIYSSRATLSRFNDNVQELFEMSLISALDFPDKSKNKSFKFKIYPLQKKLAQLLQIDKADVEVHPPIKISGGVRIMYTIHVNSLGGGPNTRDKLTKLIDSEDMAMGLKEVWSMEHTPNICGLKWHKDRKRDYQSDMVLVSMSPKMRPIQRTDQSTTVLQHHQIEESLTHTVTQSKPRFFVGNELNHSQPSYLSNQQNNNAHPSSIIAPFHAQVAIQPNSPFSPFSHSHKSSNSDGRMLHNHHQNNASAQMVGIVEVIPPPPPEPGNSNNQNSNNNRKDDEFMMLHDNKNNYNLKAIPMNEYEDDDDDDAPFRHPVGSIASVNGEAMFQQELFNHIKQQNSANQPKQFYQGY